MVARGHVWLPGDVYGCGGHAWLPGGMHGCGRGACIGYDKIRSMSGRYASYWNAFLFIIILKSTGNLFQIKMQGMNCCKVLTLCSYHFRY